MRRLKSHPTHSLLIAMIVGLWSVRAQGQVSTIVKPEFLLIVDSSGSMRAPDAGANSCGYDESRASVAACVVRNLADSVGDAIWGMQTYGLTCNAASPFLRAGPANGCGENACQYAFPAAIPANGNPFANDGFPFPFYGCDDGGTLWVNIREDLQHNLRAWGDGVITGCNNFPAAGGLGGPDLRYIPGPIRNGVPLDVTNWDEDLDVRFTPLAGSLRHAANYLRNRNGAAHPSPYVNFNGTGLPDPHRRCRPVSIILMTDGEECCGGNLCGSSSTAIGAAINARNIGCLRVDLNNDGDTTDAGEFNNDANNDGDCYDAGEQNSFRTRTYVIGLGAGLALAPLNAIAQAGGTANAFRATSEASISSAINAIVATSELVELCNGLDDNCNGLMDEGFNLGAACVANNRACSNAGSIVCNEADRNQAVCNAVAPIIVEEDTWAKCSDDVDNNCDGAVDCRDEGCTEQPFCRFDCVSTPEVCDGRDNNCNGRIDDGLGLGATCQPAGMVIPLNAMGIPIGSCRLGSEVCVAGSTICRGAVGPAMEVCNGLDDNCDGLIDEAIASATCGSNVGACRSGVVRCDLGRQSCFGSVNAVGESCDGIDNDCDGVIDNGVPEGEACGSNIGVCRLGRTRCSMGRNVCDNSIEPRPEECNCQDDDCDGRVDEIDGVQVALCSGGSVCAGAPSCGCLRPCLDAPVPCPTGRTCEVVQGQRLCVNDACADVRCPVGRRCIRGECALDSDPARCANVRCSGNQICNPNTGECEVVRCGPGLTCPRGSRCDSISRTCIPDRCADVRCAADQICVEGQCSRRPNTPGDATGNRVIAAGGSCTISRVAKQSQIPQGLLMLATIGAALLRRRNRQGA